MTISSAHRGLSWCQTLFPLSPLSCSHPLQNKKEAKRRPRHGVGRAGAAAGRAQAAPWSAQAAPWSAQVSPWSAPVAPWSACASAHLRCAWRGYIPSCLVSGYDSHQLTGFIDRCLLRGHSVCGAERGAGGRRDPVDAAAPCLLGWDKETPTPRRTQGRWCAVGAGRADADGADAHSPCTSLCLKPRLRVACSQTRR